MKYYNCCDCKQQKAKRSFTKSKYFKRGFQHTCKSCMTARKRKYYSYSQTGRRAELLSRYGITEQVYEKMYVQQNGKCAICGRINLDGRRLHVDHDHKTKKVRGLLCTSCNMALGGFQDNVEILQNAELYLERTGRFQEQKDVINP